MLISEMNIFATKNDLVKLIDTFMRQEDEPEFDFTYTFDQHEMEVFLERAAHFVPNALALRKKLHHFHFGPRPKTSILQQGGDQINSSVVLAAVDNDADNSMNENS